MPSIIDFSSNNDKFSFVLVKNPNTQKEKNEPFHAEIRKGVAYGWWLNCEPNNENNVFRVWFKDSPFGSSFARDSSFEYLDKTRYSSPYFLISIANEFFKKNLTTQTEHDKEGFFYKIKINSIYIPFKKLFSIYSNIKDLNIVFNKIEGGFYELEFSTEKSFHYLLNNVFSFCLIQSILDKNVHIDYKEDVVRKFVGVLNNSNLPYFVKYLFSKFVFQKNKYLLSKFKGCFNNDVEKHSLLETQEQRLVSVKDVLFPIKSDCLLDIGCSGEMSYSIPFSKEYKQVIAFEKDEYELFKAKSLIDSKGLINISLLNGVNVFSEIDVVNQYDSIDVLLTEVIEHNSKEYSSGLIDYILSNPKVKKVIVTVPNKDFNKFYYLEDNQFRHDDHIWEPNMNEFSSFISEVVEKHKGFVVEYKGIGDSVDNQHVSILAKIERE